MTPIRKKLIAIIAALWGCAFLALLALYLCVIVPQQEIMEYSQEKLSAKRNHLAATRNANSEERQEKWLTKVEELKNKLDIYIADVNNLDQLTFIMSKYASEIEIGRYSSRETTGDSYSMIINCEEIARLDTAINFNGSFDQMARFINTLERNKPIIFIDSFNISKGPRTGDSNKVRITLSIFLRIPKDDTEQSDTETVNLSNNKIEDSA